MDAFYASVEQRDFPELRGKPIVVTGSKDKRHGVVCAASYEARAFGIRAGMPAYQVSMLSPEIIHRPGRFDEYMKTSRKMHKIFGTYTPVIEPVGLDEAFLDVTESKRLFGSAEAIGHKIKQRIHEELRLNCTVGIAHNKLLAKLGSDMGKPNGFMIFTKDLFDQMAPKIKANKLWGIGPSVSATLALLGVVTIADLRKCPVKVLRDYLGTHSAYHLQEMALGEDSSVVIPYTLPKSFGAEETFEQDISDESQLLGRLYRLVDRVAKTLRAHHMQARTVHMKARFSDFITVGYSQTLPTPTNQTLELRRVAQVLFSVRFSRNGRPLRLLGINLSNLTPPGEICEELPLFGETDKKWELLDHVMDQAHDKYGKKIIGICMPPTPAHKKW
ncbi:DNA polymerase IV [Candidatus Sumerlaeota bacterium]|nr:DNA polymerase IV [Candidatus Sumerlaeota bacterium]